MDRCDMLASVLSRCKVSSMGGQLFHCFPCRMALGNQCLSLLPLRDPGNERIRNVAECCKPIIPNLVLDVLNVCDRWRSRQRRSTAGLASQCKCGAEKIGGPLAFFARAAFEIKRLKELAQLEPVIEGYARLLNSEFCLGNTVLVQLPALNRRAIQRGNELLAAVKRNQRGIHSVTRPAEWRGLEFLANLRTGLSGTYSLPHLLADRMLLDRSLVFERLEWLLMSSAGTLDAVFPSCRGSVCFAELRKQPHE